MDFVSQKHSVHESTFYTCRQKLSHASVIKTHKMPMENTKEKSIVLSLYSNIVFSTSLHRTYTKAQPPLVWPTFPIQALVKTVSNSPNSSTTWYYLNLNWRLHWQKQLGSRYISLPMINASLRVIFAELKSTLLSEENHWMHNMNVFLFSLS